MRGSRTHERNAEPAETPPLLVHLSTTTVIRAPRAAVWQIVTDIEHATEHLLGIQKVEVLARPPSGLVGLKWRETRILFGKPADAVMWIAEAVEGSQYSTRSEEQGAVFTKRLSLADATDGTRLTIAFDSAPQTFGARVADVVSRPLMNSAGRKALEKDLADIKKAAEARAAGKP